MMTPTSWVAVGIAACSLVVSLLSLWNSRRAGREAGWWIKADKRVWFAEDPNVLVVTVRNAGRAEVEISGMLAEFKAGRPMGLYGTVVPLILAGGRSEMVTLEHTMIGEDRAVFPDDGEDGTVEIDLASGRTVRQRIQMWHY